MSQSIGVDCIFDQDGQVRVRRVRFGDQWLQVEQGRQWVDEQGRHILIIVPGSEAQEILLGSRSLNWRLIPRKSGRKIV